jgi:hypothetical protein
MVNPTKDTIPNLIVFGHRRRNINNANLEPGQQWTALGNSDGAGTFSIQLVWQTECFPSIWQGPPDSISLCVFRSHRFPIEGTSSIQWG